MGMTRSRSPSLHAILEESPSEDYLALSEGESSGSPLPRVCNMMIPCTPSLLHHHRRRPQRSRPHRPGRSRPLHQQPSLSNRRLIRRDDDAPCMTTSSEGQCSIEAGSPVSEWPRRQGWLVGSNANQRWRQARPWRRSRRSGNSPPSPGLARMWLRWPHSWMRCRHPPLTGCVRCTNDCKASSASPSCSRRRVP
jgi:hypothetical protein